MKRGVVVSMVAVTAFFVAVNAKKIPSDMMFAIADTKYSDGKTVVLEFGEGCRSKFLGHDRLEGTASIWRKIWDDWASYGAQLWCVRPPEEPELQQGMGLDYFYSLGGKVASGVTDLKAKIIADIVEQHGYLTPELCQDYRAIVLVKFGRPKKAMQKFHQHFPNVVFVGQRTNRFVNNKFETNELFCTPELKAYRPLCKPCSKVYRPDLAAEIIKELGGQVFVIKPVNACKGRGIIFAPREVLDATLQLILLHAAELPSFGLDEDLTYWAQDPNEVFLVEQYVMSKTIYVDEKPFDGTLRMVFTIYSDQDDAGEPDIRLLGCYWKLPAKSLDEEGTLTEKHKSDIGASTVSSARLTPEDRQGAWDSLKQGLGLVYEQMMQRRGLPDLYEWIEVDDQSV